MRVLLVYPYANKEILDWVDTGAIAEPIALEYVGAAAKQDGHEVMFLDLRFHKERLEDTLVDFQPDVTGVTGYSMHVLRCLEVCRVAKELVPSCKTVVGGHHATVSPQDFFEPQIDHVVIGEGTGPFRQLLTQLEKGPSDAGILGIHSRVDGSFKYGGQPHSFNIDDIPCPDRSLVVEDRLEYNIDWMKPVALLRTSVGCPFRCSFCALWRIMDGKYYTRELDAVVEELGTLKEKYIFFVDDEPFVNAKRMQLLAEKIEEAGIKKEYFAYCRIDSILKYGDLMKQWKDIGLDRVLLGVETIFDEEAKDYNKKQNRDQILRGLQAANDLGIHLVCNFVIHPNYTDKEFDALIHFIRENNLEHPSFTVWTPLPGTDDYKNNEILVRQPNGRPNWDYYDLHHPVTKTRMPKEDFQKRFENLYMIFANKYQASQKSNIKTASEQHIKRHKEALDDAYAALAAKVLGVNRSTSDPE